MNCNPGDWLEHIAFNRAISRHTKRLEVVSCGSDMVYAYVEGEPGIQTFSPIDITRWWSPMTLGGEVPPMWPRTKFRWRGESGILNQALIISVKPGHVSFLETVARDSGQILHLFRIMDADTFLKHWELEQAPTLWQYLEHAED